MQLVTHNGSHNNTWPKTNQNPARVFGYDVFTVPPVLPASEKKAATIV